MTNEALVFALVELVHERGYASVTVQHLTARAGVSRSTFYQHYHDKDDLLFRSFEAMLLSLDRSMSHGAASDGRVAPVRELFEHVGSHRAFHESLAEAGMLERHDHVGINVFARMIERRLRARNGKGTVPPAIHARALAGALFALLRWWLDEDRPHSPAEMDAMFHALARSA